MHLNELKYHAADFVRMLPEQTLAHMAVTTKVDRYSKVLQGVRLFNLLLYALVLCKTMSQRKLEKVFESRIFCTLFRPSVLTDLPIRRLMSIRIFNSPTNPMATYKPQAGKPTFPNPFEEVKQKERKL